MLNLILGGNAAAQFGAFSFDATKFNSIGIFFLEMIMAFLLATVVLQAAVRGKAGNLAGLAIGLTLAGLILGGGAISGASINPARTLGPAIVAGNLNQVVFYIAGTVIGAALAALVSSQILGMKDENEPSSRARIPDAGTNRDRGSFRARREISFHEAGRDFPPRSK